MKISRKAAREFMDILDDVSQHLDTSNEMGQLIAQLIVEFDEAQGAYDPIDRTVQIEIEPGEL
jgi:hypothetical protein